MTTDTIWTDGLPQPQPRSQAPQQEPRGRNGKVLLAVLISLMVLAGIAVGLVVLFGGDASAAGGCGGG